MEAFITSTAIVALAEIGDKSQLLAIVLATRFKRPLPIMLGILGATITNHLLAAFVGSEAAAYLDGKWFRYLVAASFIGMGLWSLIPAGLATAKEREPRLGVFLTTLASFFLVEMGDRTQLATIALGARFKNVAEVAAGTTLGVMIADVPAVLLGNELIKRVPLQLVRLLAATLFIVVGGWMLLETAGLV